MATLLSAHAIVVSHQSLAERLATEYSGIVLADDACGSWVLDGGALHLYDVVGNAASLGEVIAELEMIAREAFAAVLCTTMHDDNAAVATLSTIGFVVDWEEADVRAGAQVQLVSLIREVA